MRSPLPFNRALDLADYEHPALAPYVQRLRDFRTTRLQGVWHRNDHAHRDWEYAEVLRKLDVLGLQPTPMSLHPFPLEPRGPRILDTGFGCSYFTQYLALAGYDVHASDSEAYGRVREKLIEQCVALGTRVPLIIAPVEDHGMIPAGHFDVTLCISVIEHLPREGFALAWRELARITKPGGYVFVTSDYFRDHDSWLHSPALGCQHNAFMPARMPEILATAQQEGGLVTVEGAPWGTVSDFTYHGEHVNDSYSFVSLTFQKPG